MTSTTPSLIHRICWALMPAERYFVAPLAGHEAQCRAQHQGDREQSAVGAPVRLTGAPPREPEHAFTRICSDSRLSGLVGEAGVLAPCERRVLREILEQMAGAHDEVQADLRFQCLLQSADL